MLAPAPKSGSLLSMSNHWKDKLPKVEQAKQAPRPTILPPPSIDPRDIEEPVEAPKPPAEPPPPWEEPKRPSAPAKAPVEPPAKSKVPELDIIGWRVVKDRHVPIQGQVAFIRKDKFIPLSSPSYLKLLQDAEVELEPVYDGP